MAKASGLHRNQDMDKVFVQDMFMLRLKRAPGTKHRKAWVDLGEQNLQVIVLNIHYIVHGID